MSLWATNLTKQAVGCIGTGHEISYCNQVQEADECHYGLQISLNKQLGALGLVMKSHTVTRSKRLMNVIMGYKSH